MRVLRKIVSFVLPKLWRKLIEDGSSYSTLSQSMKLITQQSFPPGRRNSRIIFVECKIALQKTRLAQNVAPQLTDENIIRILRFASVVDAAVDGISTLYTFAATFRQATLMFGGPSRTVGNYPASNDIGRMVIVRRCRYDLLETDGRKKGLYGQFQRHKIQLNLNQYWRRQRWRRASTSLNILEKHSLSDSKEITHGE